MRPLSKFMVLHRNFLVINLNLMRFIKNSANSLGTLKLLSIMRHLIQLIDSEMSRLRLNKNKLTDYCSILDTLILAREKHPGQRNSLDALCKRYEINNSHRDLHGALLDAEILADVYLAMTSGQSSLSLKEGGRCC